jgi:beta-mannosidase
MMTFAKRQFLHDGWQLCATNPGACDAPPALDSVVPATAWIATKLPATVASALRAAGNWSLDGATRQFDAEDWWFRLSFDGPSDASPAKWRIGFDGLATLVDVWLNGLHILRSEDMFLAHAIDVDLRPGSNELHLCCRSLQETLGRRRPRPRWRTPMVEHQQLRWFRTTLLGRTPGWSPPVAAVGPWREIWLENLREAWVEETTLQVRLDGNVGSVEFRSAIAAETAVFGDVSFRLVLARDGRECGAVPLTVFDRELHGTLVIQSPELWWPHSHGAPTLYEVRLEMHEGGVNPRVLSLGHVGFRRVEIRRTGETGFAIAVNDVEIFCRGANWTPVDPVSLNARQEDIAATLQLVRDGGMNMLRISGAMTPESEEFLAQCDHLGILLWHDLPFANMDYPAEDVAFMTHVDLEARQLLKRLAMHPCVAVVCGNSEVEQQAAMWGASRAQWTPGLFHQQLAELAASCCPQVPYWPSSAHGGPLPHTVDHGTCSYYGVGAYLRPLSDARTSNLRFATECLGFANVPEPETIDQMPGGAAIRVHHPAWKARSPRDNGAGWDFDDVRDFYLSRQFGVDPLALRHSDHSRYLQLSRLVSADAMSAAFLEWRRTGSTCGGALVWFLRDLWPGAGWGIIDSLGRPKAPYYALRRILQSQWLGFIDEGLNGLSVSFGNDSAHELDAILEIAMFREGRYPIVRVERPVRLAARSRADIPVASLLDEFHDITHAYRFGPLACDLVVGELRIPGHGSHQCHYLPKPELHVLPLDDLELKAVAYQPAGDGHVLSVRSGRFAYSVHVDVPGYQCEDQYFSLPPGSHRELKLRRIDSRPGQVAGWVTALNARAPVRIDVVRE